MRSQRHYEHSVYPSPFHSRLEPLNTIKQWGRWHDYLSADTFFDDSVEYFAVRNSCGVFDMTPMEKQRVTGPDALPYLERLLTRNVEKLKPGRVGYCVWCDDNGRLLDDGTIVSSSRRRVSHVFAVPAARLDADECDRLRRRDHQGDA